MVQNELMLPYRVLDLCDEKGILCGRILADANTGMEHRDVVEN
jgi:hypothetical protein